MATQDGCIKEEKRFQLFVPNVRIKSILEFSQILKGTLQLKQRFLTAKLYIFLYAPECASVFTVEEARGKAFQKGEKLSIGNFDLKPLKEFKSEV